MSPSTDFAPLDGPDQTWPPCDLSKIPDEEEDQPLHGYRVPTNASGLSDLIMGCATFSQIYTSSISSNVFTSSLPLRITRLALRYGITSFDTAPHYHPSELILGRALQALEPEFGRGGFRIITKCGKQGGGKGDHDISPEAVRKYVERSLKRFDVDCLDVVYIHDIEFTSSHLTPPGNPTLLPLPLHPATPLGPGDVAILLALSTLRELQAEGKISKIGIAGYPLPELLRISVLVVNTAPYIPVDIVQTYSHQNLQNTSLEHFLPLFRTLGKVPVITNASPLNMGLLTTQGMPAWHPLQGDETVKRLVGEAREVVEAEGKKLEDVAVGFGMRELRGNEGGRVPVVVGCSSLEQVHQAVKAYFDATQPQDVEEDRKARELEKKVVKMFCKGGRKNYSWQSGV